MSDSCINIRTKNSKPIFWIQSQNPYMTDQRTLRTCLRGLVVDEVVN